MNHATSGAVQLGMDGKLRPAAAGRWEALLPSPFVQNHAPFLSQCGQALYCLWFAGSPKGKFSINILRSALSDDGWSEPEQLTNDPDCSEKNPVQFCISSERPMLLHTAQSGDNQDACVVRMREVGRMPHDLPLPKGRFIRTPMHLRDDGAWLLPLFRCTSSQTRGRADSRDTAALAISEDHGKSWREIDIPGSLGCVHMTLVPLGGSRMVAFFRRRQADFVYRSESTDGGERWSAPEPTDVPNNNSSISTIRLRNGLIAMACNPVNAAMHDRRTSPCGASGEGSHPEAAGVRGPVLGLPHAPLAICLSDDEGRTFAKRVVIETGVASNNFDGGDMEISCPSLTEHADGTLDLAYSYHRRAIKHVWLTPGWLEGK